MRSSFSEVSKHRKEKWIQPRSGRTIKYANHSFKSEQPKEFVGENSFFFHLVALSVLKVLVCPGVHYCASFLIHKIHMKTHGAICSRARTIAFLLQWQWTWPKASSAGGSERMQIYLAAADDLPMNLRSLPSLSAGNARHMGPCRNVSLWNIGKRVPVPTICTHGTSCFIRAQTSS